MAPWLRTDSAMGEKKVSIEIDFQEDSASTATKDRRCFHCSPLDMVSNNMVCSFNTDRSVSMICKHYSICIDWEGLVQRHDL